MKIVLLLFIKLYWFSVAKSKRRKCIFRESCSKYVYRTTKNEGLYQGLIALRYRFHNCRAGFNVFEDTIDGGIFMVLPDASILREAEISERLIPLSKV